MLALEGFFAIVFYDMCLKMFSLDACIVTLVALIGLFSSVCFQMVFSNCMHGWMQSCTGCIYSVSLCYVFSCEFSHGLPQWMQNHTVYICIIHYVASYVLPDCLNNLIQMSTCHNYVFSQATWYSECVDSYDSQSILSQRCNVFSDCFKLRKCLYSMSASFYFVGQTVRI